MAADSPISWIVEPVVFPDRYQHFIAAIKRAGHELLIWDETTTLESVPAPEHDVCVFHGSLGTAANIRKAARWSPGAYCNIDGFHCSAWYPTAREYLLASQWGRATVQSLVDDPLGVAGDLACDGRLFVRPDSPLKPFSGRVCTLSNLSLADLDFGFYYDDPSLPIVFSPVTDVVAEWRFVIAGGRIAAVSGYEADGRSAVANGDIPTAVARRIATDFDPPDSVYVMDLCLSEDEVKLVEINPFSGADLYACDPAAIVEAVSAQARLDAAKANAR